MFGWLSKMIMKTPYQGCSSCGNSSRDKMEELRKKVVDGDIDDVNYIPAAGCCTSGGGSCSDSGECNCSDNGECGCGDDCKCKDKQSSEESYGMSFKL